MTSSPSAPFVAPRLQQIYKSDKKIAIDVQRINVSALDFREAMAVVTPAAQVYRDMAKPRRASHCAGPNLTNLFCPACRRSHGAKIARGAQAIV